MHALRDWCDDARDLKNKTPLRLIEAAAGRTIEMS
jgi:hypothetical protein